MAPPVKRKALIIGAVVVICAIVGAVVGIVVWKTTGDSEDVSNSSGSENRDGKSGGSSSSSSSTSKSNSSSSANETTKGITSDPTKATYSLAAYAIGDWGTTIARDSCCKRRTDHDPTNVDKNAEEAVGVLMGLAAAAAKPKPKVVIGHGDNFYWTGINSQTDQAYRFSNTFESKFNNPALLDVPWVNVMGNHDYGGASFICEGGCADSAAIVAGLKTKFALQAEYKSPNSNRWVLSDHFFVHSIKDDASGVSVDIFNLDTNDADSHGAQQICCQCYAYAGGDDGKCKNVARGDAFCAAGKTDMYDACMKQLNAWGEDSRTQLAAKVKASKATWKIVNAHYSPYNHYAADRQPMWKDLLKGLDGVQLWMNGHTHGEKHDHAAELGLHFIENGAGGGILNEAASGIPPYVTYVKSLWTYANHDYGFFELTASKEWLRVRFLTFDDKWSIADEFKASTIGGVAAHHCWYIPVDGAVGKSCNSVTVLSRDSKSPSMSKRKRLIMIGAIVVLAAVGAGVAVVVSKGSSDSSTASGDNAASGNSTSGGSGGSSGTNSGGKASAKNPTGSSGSNSSLSSASKITSDPTKATYSLAAFAIGDWGTTVEKGSCCKKATDYTDFDVIAEDVVAKLMNIQAGAADVKPKAVLSHGDNFYWSGINGATDAKYRFTQTFENKFVGENLKNIPWVNVLGNHDYGGSSFVCSSNGEMAKCNSKAELLAAIDNKFDWQAKYKSEFGNRWVLEDHFYVYSIKDAASGVSIDIFNVDTNDADTHGALQICCQCYGYADGDDDECNNISPGKPYCTGGDLDAYNACFAKFTAWGDDSRKQLAAKVKASTATWKIVNSHYSPYNHYAPAGMKTWFDILKGSGVHLWMNGHTHGEKHDYSESLGVHFVENGAGGGIIKESASGIPGYAAEYMVNKWVYGGREYGFFSVTASKEWLRIQYHTADSKWTMAETIGSAKVGGVATKHCWYIPLDGSVGKDCTATS
ncbi:hypothetical protein PybrP1_000563, partial [[Pythium] brassicae (nom. inval.)]